MDNKITQVKVKDITYDILDSSVPNHVRTITQKDIDNWNDKKNDYSLAINKPSINNVELDKDKTADQLGLQDKMNAMTNSEIQNIIDGII